MANKTFKSLTPQGLDTTYKVPATAPEYAATNTYAVGDLAVYQGVLYKCTTAIDTPEAWTVQHWQDTTIGDEVSTLKESTDYNDKVLYPQNIAGFVANVYYEINPPIKVGEKFVIKTIDGEAIGAYADYEWCDENKERIGSKRFYATDSVNNTTVANSDMHYFRWIGQPIKIMLISRETPLEQYSPYYLPINNYAPYLVDAEDYHKQKISYPESFTTHNYSKHATGNIASSNNYVGTEMIHLVAGDVLHYALCTYASENIIGIYEMDGSYNSELSISGLDQNHVKEGILEIDHECYAIVSHRDVNVTTAKKYFYINNSIFQQLSEMVTEPEAEENTFVSGYGTLDGWQSHAEAFSKMMIDVENTEGFMFLTDSHFMSKATGAWEEYAQQIFAYLEKLYYSSPCSFVLHGGDWLGTGEAREDFLYKLSAINGAFRRNFDKFALLVGNHESGNQSAEHTMFTHDTLAATLLANVGKTYYKFDANTFRMYCFDSWQSGALDSFANEQIDWFAEALTNETTEHIVIAIHILYDNDNLSAIGNQITLCAQAYNSRSTFTYNNETYDFTNATGKVAFVIAGHEHGDKMGSVNDIPYILTRNLTGYGETAFANLPLPLDLMKVDWQTAKLTAYRAIRGSEGTTRELSIVT